MSQSGIFPGNKSGYQAVPTPSGNNLSYFLNSNDGDKLYAKRSDGSVFPIKVGGSGGSVYELIATVTKDDINALAGLVDGFAITSVLFNSRIPISMYIKTTEVFDVDLWGLQSANINSAIFDVVSTFNGFASNIPGLNQLNIGTLSSTYNINNPSTDTINFLCRNHNPGKGATFIGGNTIGKVEVYALWQPIV